MHNPRHYAVIFSDKVMGKTYSEMTNGIEKISEAMEDARTLHDDGKRVLGLYQIDLIDGGMTSIHTGAQLRDLFAAEREEAYFYENASERDMDFLCMTGCMNLGRAA